MGGVCQLHGALQPRITPSGSLFTAVRLFVGRPDPERVDCSEQQHPRSRLTDPEHPAFDWRLKAIALAKGTGGSGLSVDLASCLLAL